MTGTENKLDHVVDPAGNQNSEGISSSSSTPTTQGFSAPWMTDVEKARQDSAKDIERVNNLMIGLVIFIAITFIVEIAVMNYDRIKDKDIYLNYNQLYKDYFDESSELKEDINVQKTELNNLNNKIETLKARNPYLK
jgi:hypothetical protein